MKVLLDLNNRLLLNALDAEEHKHIEFILKTEHYWVHLKQECVNTTQNLALTTIVKGQDLVRVGVALSEFLNHGVELMSRTWED